MSINWVMLTVDGKDIVPLDKEIIFYRKENVKFELDCSNGSSFNSKSGSLILTNQRVVYLCQNPNSYFATASMPINNIQDSKLTQPWFSSPVFKAVVMPVQGGGLTQPGRLAITFADGSLHEFDFQYRALKERLQELDGAAPEHLEQLPQYDAPSEPLPPSASATTITTPAPLASSTSSAPAPAPHPLPTPTSTSTTSTAASLSSTTSAPAQPQPSTVPAPSPGPTPTPTPVATDLPPSYDDIH
ncbi:hypothetical protein BGZ74_006925 [Mortierella antarctica]|nr:hypothetical protein BGZ74_006925 [Mortierella antarctica]